MSEGINNDEGIDNTNAVSNIVESGDLHEVSMILGSRERIRHAGVIRPGIKVPLRDVTEAQKKVYRQLLDEGRGFEFIDSEMLKIAPKSYTKKTCLMPSNSDYFTIRDEDFKRPADAEYIRKTFADPDGKVRRIKCWVPVSEIDKVMPHNFRAFSAGGLRCVSFYDHGRLKFRYLPKGFTGNAKPEDWLVLDADDDDKASAACGIKVRFGGLYRMYVDGCRGAGEIVCPTQSWYGLSESAAVLKRISGCLGRFNNLLGGRQFLELRKEQVQVKTPDGRKQMQWVVQMDLNDDFSMADLARYAEPHAVAARSIHAFSEFTGHVMRPQSVADIPVVPLHDHDHCLPPLVADTKDQAHNGIKALLGLFSPLGLDMDDLDNLSAVTNDGSVVGDLDVDALRQFYRQVKGSIISNPDTFANDVKAMRAT